MKKVAILTNGGDAPGLNAVIRAIVKTAENNGISGFSWQMQHHSTNKFGSMMLPA